MFDSRAVAQDALAYFMELAVKYNFPFLCQFIIAPYISDCFTFDAKF